MKISPGIKLVAVEVAAFAIAAILASMLAVGVASNILMGWKR